MAYTRVTARRGQEVDLNATFYRGGIATDPFLIYKIEIYRGSTSTANLVTTINLPDVEGSGGSGGSDGSFTLTWAVPDTAVVPDVYFDVWYYFGSDPCAGAGTGTDCTVADHEDELLSACNKFWVYPDAWFVASGLQTIRFGFEPQDIKFHRPEVRPLEVGIMPLPLYDYDYNLVIPIIPYITYTISIFTENCETVVDEAAMTIKTRQGAYRSNPWVASYNLDTSTFYIGTYKYRVTATLPNGSTRVSGDFYLTIS